MQDGKGLFLAEFCSVQKPVHDRMALVELGPAASMLGYGDRFTGWFFTTGSPTQPVRLLIDGTTLL